MASKKVKDSNAKKDWTDDEISLLNVEPFRLEKLEGFKDWKDSPVAK